MPSSRVTLHLRKLRSMVPALQAELVAKVAAVEAAQFHQENFRARKWTERGNAWKRRKDADQGRALLVKTGRLRRTATHGRVRRDRVDFVMPPYGKVHNNGLKAGRGEGFTMPQRQFAGESRILKQRFRRKATIVISRRLKNL